MRKEEIIRRKEYDFSKGVKNPYTKPEKAIVTIRLSKTTVEYFKCLAKQVNMPYQTLIDSYLTECATKKKKLELVWH